MRVTQILSCLAAFPLLTGASPPVTIKPSSKWVLDYADDSCRLIRVFGQEKSETKLLFESVAPEEMTMLVVGGALRADDGMLPVKARLLPRKGEPLIGASARADKGGQGAAIWSHLPFEKDYDDKPEKKPAAGRERARVDERKPIDRIKWAAARAERMKLAEQTTGIEIEQRQGHGVILETGSLGSPLKMFDECERDLLRQWGVDPDVQDRIVKPVWTKSLMSLFSSGDYPTAMLAARAQSNVRVRLLVDAGGKVAKCASISLFNAPDFNRLVCDVFRTRARFEPAELADGTKVASYYTQRVNFRMP